MLNRTCGAIVLLGRPRPVTGRQVLQPIQDPNEMDLSLPEAEARVVDISRAFASYVRSLFSAIRRSIGL
jgi:hypothetical protein